MWDEINVFVNSLFFIELGTHRNEECEFKISNNSSIFDGLILQNGSYSGVFPHNIVEVFREFLS